MRPPKIPIALRFSALALLVPVVAAADGTKLRADHLADKALRLDGVPKEWPTRPSPLTPLRGAPSKDDLEARALLGYDDANLYLGADVTDDRLQPGGDRVSLLLAFRGAGVHEVEVYPGEPGKSAGSVKLRGGGVVAGAKVVEALRTGGYTLEASIPWTAFPPARTIRVALRGAILVHDADGSRAVEAVAGTSSATSYDSLPAVLLAPEQALEDGLLRQKQISSAPRHDFVADVAGDASRERILVYERFLVILGPRFRGGAGYYWSDMGVDVENGMLPFADVKDVTGDAKAELLFRKRLGMGRAWRELFQVQVVGDDETPRTIFQHETGISTATGSIQNEVSLQGDAAKPLVRVAVGPYEGFTKANYHEKTERAFDPLLLPWGPVKARRFAWDGAKFKVFDEEKQDAKVIEALSAPPPPAEPPAPAPKPPSAAELLDQVYAMYKRERGASGKPRFDYAIQVAEDARPERVLVHDRDLIVFGKGFRGGTGYVFTTLQQFASSSDITELTARDLTGDGRAELLVRGSVSVAAPPELGSGKLRRELLLVYQVSAQGLRRIFAAELARVAGTQRLESKISYVRAGGALEIELTPGKATGWDDRSYPFAQETAPPGGVEPILLPWTTPKPVRFRLQNGVYAR